MNVGLVMFATDYAIRPDELARAAEARGFESLWLPEHTHIPVSRRSPWPGGPNLPKEYWHTYDPFVALAMAAAVTSKLRLATGFFLLVVRDPITTGMVVASLDHLSGGRVIFGIGGGWNAEEMADHGTDFRNRWTILRERVLAMKQLWTQDEALFTGEYVRFEPSWAWPKPVQRPHPPVVLGSNAKRALERVVDYCDGWMPIGARTRELHADLDRLRTLALERGRDPRSIEVSLFGAPADADKLRRLSDAGVHRAVLPLPSAGSDTVLPLLDRYAPIVAAVR
jgi:probable F420-dependent oxidoreductase